MQRSIFKALSVSLGAAALVSMSAAGFAAGMTVSIDNGKKIFEQGKGDVPACNSCHGPAGMGDDNMGTPRLAGQVFQFIAKQLDDFAEDKRQDTTMFVMNANAKGLSKQDRLDVAAYVNSMPVKQDQLSKLDDLAANGTAVGEVHVGKIIVNYGLPEKGVPACMSCHGYNGRGVEPMYPRIGEQKYTYIVNQLKKWRDESRANDPMGQMRAVAKKMSDEDINNAAAYLVSASPFTEGNTRVPTEHLPYSH